MNTFTLCLQLLVVKQNNSMSRFNSEYLHAVSAVVRKVVKQNHSMSRFNSEYLHAVSAVVGC